MVSDVHPSPEGLQIPREGLTSAEYVQAALPAIKSSRSQCTAEIRLQITGPAWALSRAAVRTGLGSPTARRYPCLLTLSQLTLPLLTPLLASPPGPSPSQLAGLMHSHQRGAGRRGRARPRDHTPPPRQPPAVIHATATFP